MENKNMKLFNRNIIASLLLISFSTISNAVEVKMKSLSYDPKQVQITEGESITWKNIALTQHSATSGDTPPVFDTGMVDPGKESKPIRFEKAGEFKYNCSLHGKTMSGIVVVRKSSK
jgi:plastocyanin